jgi:group I intron endonuclease
MKNTIYIHKNKINGKCYVGQTKKKLEYRWGPNGKEYLTIRNGKYSQEKFANAILKYGWDNFEHIVVYENLSFEEANEKEKELILKYNSVNEGYNSEWGGKTQKIISEETRKKISKNMTGENNHMHGRIPWNKGLTLPEEYREKIRKPSKKKSESKKGEKNPMYGKKGKDMFNEYFTPEQQEAFKYY